MRQKFFAAADSDSGVSPEQKAREAELTSRQAEADKENKGRSGKGTRVRVGQTRGKNPKVITWEAFDTDQPETCPESVAEFVELTKSEAKQIVSYIIDGFNAAQYSAASDVLAEFVEPNWPDDFARKFKLAISNYASATGVSLEEAVSLMKPGMVKAFEARLAAAKQ